MSLGRDRQRGGYRLAAKSTGSPVTSAWLWGSSAKYHRQPTEALRGQNTTPGAQGRDGLPSKPSRSALDCPQGTAHTP